LKDTDRNCTCDLRSTASSMAAVKRSIY